MPVLCLEPLFSCLLPTLSTLGSARVCERRHAPAPPHSAVLSKKGSTSDARLSCCGYAASQENDSPSPDSLGFWCLAGGGSGTFRGSCGTVSGFLTFTALEYIKQFSIPAAGWQIAHVPRISLEIKELSASNTKDQLCLWCNYWNSLGMMSTKDGRHIKIV